MMNCVLKFLILFLPQKKSDMEQGRGLSIDYDVVVNKHYGEINVESTSGVGTTFAVRLPV